MKVITGRFEGETGLIIRVEENSVIIFSDLTNQEVIFTPKKIILNLSQKKILPPNF